LLSVTGTDPDPLLKEFYFQEGLNLVSDLPNIFKVPSELGTGMILKVFKMGFLNILFKENLVLVYCHGQIMKLKKLRYPVLITLVKIFSYICSNPVSEQSRSRIALWPLFGALEILIRILIIVSLHVNGSRSDLCLESYN
jgi:hypothetical protein